MEKDLMIAAALIAGVANTASSAGDKSGEITDTMKTRNLQEIQVVSTRVTKKTPMAFTNISKQDIQSVNHGKDLPEMLSLTPSVTMTSDAGNGIGYTSLRVRGTDPSRINITANGVPMNDAEDSFTNALSFMGLWALAHKYIEQWFFWILVDGVCCYLYVVKGIPFKACLYGLYVIIAIAGYFKWKKSMLCKGEKPQTI